jgi:hypothetical protein
MANTMHLEMKFLRLRIPGTIGSRFDDWTVSWIGGWSKHRLHYLVMVVRCKTGPDEEPEPPFAAVASTTRIDSCPPTIEMSSTPSSSSRRMAKPKTLS